MVDYYSTLTEVMQANVVDAADITDSTDKWNYLTKYNDNLNCADYIDLGTCLVSAVADTCDYTDCSTGSSGTDYTWFKLGLFGVDLS